MALQSFTVYAYVLSISVLIILFTLPCVVHFFDYFVREQIHLFPIVCSF